MKKDIKTDDVYKFDQFFTKDAIAQKCIDEVNSLFNLESFDLIIEPSAGTGSFFNKINHTKIGIEIDKDLCEVNKEYKCMSFFDYTTNNDKKILVIGNPPFGTQNKLSVDFFNHAAKFADVIAFIIPKTWKKNSIHNRLNLGFVLVKDIDLPEDCFYGNKQTNVKCCFQIWKQSSEKRIKEDKILCHSDWDFLSYTKSDKDLMPPSDCDFVILAYGSNSGQISKDINRWRPKSVHFIKSNIDVNTLISRFEDLDYSHSNNSSRQSSLCKTDLVKLYMEKYDK